MTVLSQSHLPVTRSELPWALRQGALAGVVAGVVFAAFEMAAAGAISGWSAIAQPLRMSGAIVLGPMALEPTYPFVTAVMTGVVVHLVLSAVYGSVFAVAAAGLRPRRTLITLATAYGLALGLLNFYVIAPAAFPWFRETSPIVQFVAHTFFFGTLMGYAIWRAHEGLLRRAMAGG